MSDSAFAAILTLAFFAFLFVWVPFLDGAFLVAASLKRRRTSPELNSPRRDYNSAAV